MPAPGNFISARIWVSPGAHDNNVQPSPERSFHLLITLTAKTPLLMHNARLADPDDPWSRQIAAINRKRSDKTDEDNREVSRLQFGGGMYYNADVGPYLPGPNLIRALRNAGNLVKKNRGGKQIERGFILQTTTAPLQYKGPRDLDELWGEGASEFVDRRMVKIPQGGRVPATRPIFVDWSAQFEFELDANEINEEDFVAYAEKAGKVEGVGDGRRIGYGRFTVDVEQ